MPLYPPSAAASLELTDGTHDVDPVAKITVTGATVGGTTPDATLTVSGGASGGTPALTLGTSNAAGSSGTFIRDDDQIAVFDATTPAGVAESASHGSTGYAADAGHAHPGLGAALGLTGATGATRYVGATTSGHPTSGTFAVGDYVVAQDGHVWVCTGAGTSGTWVDTGAGGGIADEGAFTYLDATDAAAPGNPSAGYHRIYSKTGGLYYRDSSGTEVGPLAAAGSGGVEFTDGTHDVTGATKLTVTGGTIGGTTPNATLTVAGGGGSSPLVSVGTFVDGSSTITLLHPGPCKQGNLIFLAVGSSNYQVSSVAQTGVTWSLVDKGVLLSGNYCIAELWIGVVGAGAKNKIVVTMAGGNGCWAIEAEITGWSTGTVASHNNATHASGADLSLGSITSSPGNLVVAALCQRGTPANPPGLYGGYLVGLPGGGYTNQIATPVNFAWWKSDGTTITPGMQDVGDNMAGAWGVISA